MPAADRDVKMHEDISSALCGMAMESTAPPTECPEAASNEDGPSRGPSLGVSGLSSELTPKETDEQQHTIASAGEASNPRDASEVAQWSEDAGIVMEGEGVSELLAELMQMHAVSTRVPPWINGAQRNGEQSVNRRW